MKDAGARAGREVTAETLLCLASAVISVEAPDEVATGTSERESNMVATKMAKFI